MNDPQGVPAAPSDRDLPNHRRTREELLMKIGPENNGTPSRRRWAIRWGVPLGVATGVTAMSVAAVVVLGGSGSAGPGAADPAHGGADPANSTPAPSPSASSSPGGTSPEADFTVTDATTTPIDAGTATRILSSCLGADASRYHAVVAVRTPLATEDWDGVVVAVDSAGQYVQCQSKGDKGTSQDSPPTFINDRLWGTGRIVEYFDSMLMPAGEGSTSAWAPDTTRPTSPRSPSATGRTRSSTRPAWPTARSSTGPRSRRTRPRPALHGPEPLRPCLRRVGQGDLQPGRGPEVHRRAVGLPSWPRGEIRRKNSSVQACCSSVSGTLARRARRTAAQAGSGAEPSSIIRQTAIREDLPMPRRQCATTWAPVRNPRSAPAAAGVPRARTGP